MTYKQHKFDVSYRCSEAEYWSIHIHTQIVRSA